MLRFSTAYPMRWSRDLAATQAAKILARILQKQNKRSCEKPVYTVNRSVRLRQK